MKAAGGDVELKDAVATFSLGQVVRAFKHGDNQLVAVRYSYLACMPWAVLAGGGILFALARWTPAARGALLAASAAIAVVRVFLSRAQAETWKDNARSSSTRSPSASAPRSRT